MSVQDIVKYVRQTPGNTNPSVIASMVNAEMNSILEEAKKYTDSQRLVHIETERYTMLPRQTITCVQEGSVGLSVYQGPYDLNLWDMFVWLNTRPNYTVSVELDGRKYNTNFHPEIEDGAIVLGNVGILDLGTDTGEPFVIAFGENNFTFVLHDSSESVTVEVSITLENEIIHPIDPKYLPGVCLPVVELSTTFTHGGDLTGEEDELLKAAYEGDIPIVIRCDIDLGDNGSFKNVVAVWNKAYMDGNLKMCMFVASLGTNVLQIYSIDNGETWGCMID